ncbi:UNVERIFIED_CONTAM: hypothetical protein PYX00_008310 [Menopon gallinae]|uniref:Serine/threonine-protein phosphatase CPPED1 n=1 Tax=Menopon gallinae TaxID=328185 RepID=A0AAW2HMK6_9NEOP
MEAESWKIYSRNNQFECFDESKEKNWSGPFFFVQGADIQFGMISKLEKQEQINWEAEKKLAEAIVKKVNAMRPRPRFFIICGDLCDAFPVTEQKIRDAQVADFKRIFSKVDKEVPLVCVCGNHDIGNTPTHETVQQYRTTFGDDYFSFYCGGILFLVINSQYYFDPSQVLDLADEHNKWIEKKFEEAKKNGVKRLVIFQHIPWFINSVDEKEDPIFTLKPEVRRKWLDKFKEGGVEAIFCGHRHMNGGGEYRGMKIVVTTAIGAQLGNDKSGARIVKMLENKIDHKYYAIDDLPLKN